MLAAAVAELLSKLSASFAGSIAQRLPDVVGQPWRGRVAPAAEVLWTIFRSAELRAVYEVYIAARTEPALDAELEGIVAGHRSRILVLAERVFPELCEHPEFEDAVATVIFAMQGASVGLFGTGVRNESEILAFFRRLAQRELGTLEAP